MNPYKQKRLEKICYGCKDLLFWDRDCKMGKISTNTGKDEGYWVGDLDKEPHTQERCERTQKHKGLQKEAEQDFHDIEPLGTGTKIPVEDSDRIF